MNAHRWIGNDDSKCEHHNLVDFTAEPFALILGWKSSRDSVPCLIGHYRLNLMTLSEAGFVSNPEGKKVRLRFFHAPNGCIYIQPFGSNSDALLIGEFRDRLF